MLQGALALPQKVQRRVAEVLQNAIQVWAKHPRTRTSGLLGPSVNVILSSTVQQDLRDGEGTVHPACRCGGSRRKS